MRVGTKLRAKFIEFDSHNFEPHKSSSQYDDDVLWFFPSDSHFAIFIYS